MGYPGQKTNPYGNDPAFDAYYGQMSQPGRTSAVGNFGGGFLPPPAPAPAPALAAVPPPPQMPKGLSPLEQLQWKAANGKNPGINSVIAAAPGYNGITDKDGKLGANFTMGYGGLASFDKMKELALGEGPSSQYNDTSKAIDLNRDVSLDAVANDANAAMYMGNSNLAQTGGLDTGARERIAESTGLGRMKTQQGVYMGADQQRAGALLADNQMKNNFLNSLAGYDATARATNVNNRIKDRQGGNMFDLERWGKMGDIIGSGKAADAMKPSNNDSGLFGYKTWFG